MVGEGLAPPEIRADITVCFLGRRGADLYRVCKNLFEIAVVARMAEIDDCLKNPPTYIICEIFSKIY